MTRIIFRGGLKSKIVTTYFIVAITLIFYFILTGDGDEGMGIAISIFWPIAAIFLLISFIVWIFR